MGNALGKWQVIARIRYADDEAKEKEEGEF